jgi:hypothetical protein
MAKVNLMTQAEYAKHRGCSAVAVFKAVKGGRISLIDSKIDPVVADIQWANNSRVRAPNRKPEGAESLASVASVAASAGKELETPAMVPGGVDDYLVSRSRREAAEAKMAEMKEAEMRGKYLVKAEVDAAIFEVARAMRDGLNNCARRIAADVAGMDQSAECEAVIDREHRALLENMSHRLSSKLGAPTSESGAGPQ